MKRKLYLSALMLAAALAACSAGGSRQAPAAEHAAESALKVPAFCADSAYQAVAAQVAMGPRVPGSDAAAVCAGWIADRLRAAGADTVMVQTGTATRFDGLSLALRNVFASFRPDAPRRILLLAHYDTRPWADMEADPVRRMQPIPGANDGASGVAVLLEMARVMAAAPSAVGVDMLFVDGEDSGYGELIAPEGMPEPADSWCLGTQMWAASRPYAPGRAPAYAVLLDMVGGPDARFHREQFSDAAAARVVDRIWAEAAALGYADYFPNARGGAVVDDHVYVNRLGIPAVDIIESFNPATGSFPPAWHTHADDLPAIDPQSLARVGTTLLNLIYKEKAK